MYVAALPGKGREPPGLAGLLARRSFRYSASQALCDPLDTSGLGAAEALKNLRPEERRLGTLEVDSC